MSRPWSVLKFGGTSVASAEGWAVAARRVRELQPSHRSWLVVSAIAGVSDLLERAIEEARRGTAGESLEAIRAAHTQLSDDLGFGGELPYEVNALLEDLGSRLAGIRLTGEASARLTARLMAVGELASSRMGILALGKHGVEARWVDARELLVTRRGVRESEHARYLHADPPGERRPEDAERQACGAEVVLTQGFIARNREGETCLLGRGGSDTSAALFAALLDAASLEIWTDVHGLFTADPRLVPVARLITRIGYPEAQELAANGAKVLHPRCLVPVAAQGIPVSVRCTADPGRPGTTIESAGESHPVVTAVTSRTGVTLLSISTLDMWGASGFLARVFAPFEELGVSVDLVATSQSAISVTLDGIPGGVRGDVFARLVAKLETLGQVRVVHPCGVVSIVGRRIRAALHELGPAMEVFQEKPVHLVSDSSEDLNLSFVVDEDATRPLVVRLHERLFATRGGDARLGPTWEMLEGHPAGTGATQPWWKRDRERLIDLVGDGQARYVYHRPTVARQARALTESLRSIDQIFYSMKANPHPRLLETLADAGLGIECVSAAEVLHARKILGDAVPILFTPNFCPISEYGVALDAGAEVTVDGPEPFELAQDVFRGREVGLRIDPGRGLGHHEKVVTAGRKAKFGQRIDEVEPLLEAAAACGATVVGLHAHVGSGILDPKSWASTGRRLASLLERIPDVRWIDLGGGLGVPERPGQEPLALDQLDRHLDELRRGLGEIRLRIEPGRFLVSEAGVLVAPVTQIRTKAGVSYIGIATGMNSLLRPALYGSWHGIHNLSRIDAPPAGYWNVVGPICETGDLLGHDRWLPETRPGDVLLIEYAGAYGAVMASSYNLRAPAAEIVLED